MRSLLRKRVEVCSYLETSNCDILLRTETWLHSDITDDEILQPSVDYNTYCKDRDGRRGGGVLIAIKKNITAFPLEITWVCVPSSHSKNVFGICYRPPDSTATFTSYLYENICEITTKFPKANIFLFGDFYYPEIDWANLTSPCQHSNDFVALALDFSLVKMIQKPTRGNNVLDLVFTSIPETVASVSLMPGFSDHLLVSLTIKLPLYKRTTTPKRIFNYKKADFTAINIGLENFYSSFIRNFVSRSVEENRKLF